MLDLTRKITTRDGRAVRVLCTDCKGANHPVLVLVTEPSGNENIVSYKLDGRYTASTVSASDLINPPIEEERFTVVYPNGDLGIYTYVDEVGVKANYPTSLSQGARVVKVRITVIE